MAKSVQSVEKMIYDNLYKKHSLWYNNRTMDDLTQITYIGKTDFRNQMTQFGIRAKDRFRHMYVIGKSGTGKTTLLENMIVQDIYNGNGIVFIDPHGESADKLLRYIPTSRIDDVIYFSPGDSEFPVAFNPLEISENSSPSERSLIADGLMTVFKKIWPDAFSGRMEYILNNSMLALLEYPEPSLLSVNRMLTDKDFRKKVIASVTDPTVRNAWDELSKWDDKRWSEAIGALVNKVGQFTTNPVVRNIIGQAKSTFNFREAMDSRKIVIINLSKGLIGEESAKLIGALLITKVYLAAMSRANLSPEQLAVMPPLYFYVDEFQNFANDSFANILSEARKYKLALTVANQYIAQMEETIRDAVFGNMGTTITFRLGPFDAEFVERVFTPTFNTEDLQNIGFGQVFMTLLIDGMSSRPFSAATLGPIQPKEPPQLDRVIAASRAQYAKNRVEVEEKIMAWFNEQRTVIKKDTDRKPGETSSTKIVFSQNSEKPKSFQPKKITAFEIENKAKLQEVSGAHPKPVQPAKKVTTVINNVPEPISSKIDSLLDKFDTMSDSQTSIQIESPTVNPRPIINSKTVQPLQSKSKILNNPIKDKSASIDTKNALLEALQKAKASQVHEPKKVVENQLTLQQTIDNARSGHSIPKSEESQISNSVTMSVNRNSVSQESGHSTVREVPEDILKKILE